MNHSCYRFLSNIYSWLLVSLLGTFSTSAFSANNFSFVDYNLAFILGLSLPLILISALLSKKAPINWQFSVALTLSLFFLLYILGHATQLQNLIVLSSAIVLFTLINLWPFYSKKTPASRYNKVAPVSMIILGASYLISLWFFPQFDAYNLWLVATGLILLISLARLIELINTSAQYIARLFLQWLSGCFLAASIYLWLNTQVSLNILVITAVLTYLITIINGSWVLIQTIYHAINKKAIDELSTMTQDELFSYTHDPVTNLPTIQHALNQFEQYLTQEKDPNYAIIVFQPINFTQVNSILGHQNSDILLLQLAYTLQQKALTHPELLTFEQTQPPTKIARLQGLKFLIILNLKNNPHPEKIVIDDLCQQFAKTVPTAMSFKSFSLNFELAFGVSLLNDFAIKPNEAIAHAEDALLVGQQQQKAICYFDSSSLLYTEQQLAKMERLKQAITEDDLQWLVHPQISVSTKSILGFKLEAYWRYSNKQAQGNNNLLSFSEFSKTAELSGDIYKLAQQMINKAFVLLQTLHKAEYYHYVAIDFSSKQLLEPELISFIEQQSQHYNISPKYLTIEFSEEIIFAAHTRTQQMIDQLRTLDINIAIANFSGSYDALRFLRKIIVSQIKISCKKLIDDEAFATDKAIINALLNLATTIDIPVIGTEVDNQVIAKNFAEIGGQYIQGKVISNGLSLAQIPHWLSAWHQQYPKSC